VFPGPLPLSVLTLSGNEITDASRAVGTQGDGLSGDDSYGLWDATTNVVTNPSYESGLTGWSNTGTAYTLDTNWKKFGTQSAKLVYVGVASSLSQIIAGAAPGDVWTLSCFVNLVSGRNKIFLQFLDASNNVLSSTSVVNSTLGESRQRFTSAAAPASTAKIRIFVNYMDATDNGTAYVDGVQLEKKPIATPFALVSRNVARVQAAANLLDETQGWVSMRMRMGWGVSSKPGGGAGFEFPWGWRDSGNERLNLYFRESNNTWSMRRFTGGAGTDAVSVADNFAVGDLRTIVVAWTATQVKISVQGVSFVVAANATIPTLAANLFDIGSDGAGGGFLLDGDLMWFACGFGTLTDADAAALFALGNTAPDVASWSVAPREMTMVWPATDASISIDQEALYPGRGTNLSAQAATPRTLTETTA